MDIEGLRIYQHELGLEFGFGSNVELSLTFPHVNHAGPFGFSDPYFYVVGEEFNLHRAVS